MSIVQDPLLGNLSGKMLDIETGLPVQGVVISATGAGSYSTQTDINGLFNLSNLIPSSYTLVTNKSGYFPLQSNVTLSAGQTINSNTNLERDVTPTLLSISGQIVDADSATPLSAAQIVINNTSITTTSSIDGFFNVSGLNPGSYSVTVSSSGYTNVGLSISAAAGGEVDIGVVPLSLIDIAKTMGTITGQLVDAVNGLAIRGAL